MAFDIEGARKAGYSDAEIADHLAAESGFDVAGARKAGYGDEDLIKHLTAAPTTEQATAAADAAEPNPMLRTDPTAGQKQDTALSRIGEAAVEGATGPAFLTPAAKAEAEAQNQQTWVGRNVVSPLVAASELPFRAVNALGAGLGQTAYELGNAISGPSGGRSAYMLNQILPTAGMGTGVPRVPGRMLPGREVPEPVPPPRFMHEITGEPNPFAQQFGPPPPPASPSFVPPGGPGTSLPRILEILRQDEATAANKPEMIPPTTATDPVTGGVAPIKQPPVEGVPQPNAFAPKETAPPPPQPPPPPGTPGGPTPTTAAEAKAVANTWYKIHEDAGGARLPADFADNFVDRIQAIGRQTEAGKIVGGDTEITKLIERANKDLRGQRITLQAAQDMDEAIGDLIDKEMTPRGLSKAGHDLEELQHTLRDMIEKAAPAGDAGAPGAVEALTNGRKAWSQYRKMDDLERIERRAALTEQPTTEHRRMIRSLLANDKRIRGYSDVEKAALKKAADRGEYGELMHTMGSRLTTLAIAGGGGLFGGGPLGMVAGIYAAHRITKRARDWGVTAQGRRMERARAVLGSSVPMPGTPNAFAPPP